MKVILTLPPLMEIFHQKIFLIIDAFPNSLEFSHDLDNDIYL